MSERFESDFKNLTLKELELVHTALLSQVKNAVYKAIQSKKLQWPEESELALAKTDKLKAIKAYRKRVGCSLIVSNFVLQHGLTSCFILGEEKN